MWSLSLIFTQATVFDWCLLTCGLLLLIYIAGTWRYDYFSRRGIPSPIPRIPFMGNTLEIFLGFEPIPEFMRRLISMSKGHSIAGMFEFYQPIFTIISPKMLKIVAVKEFDKFINHRGFLSEEADPLFGKNLFNLRDHRWREMRATLSPAFTTSKIKGMFSLVSQCAEQMTQHIREKCAENKGNEEKGLETDMKDLFTRMANDVIATVAFGLQCDSLQQPKNEFYKNGKLLTSVTFLREVTLLVFLVFPKIVEALKIPFLSPKAMSFFNSLVHETIKNRKEMDIFRPDMLQLLMQAKEGKLKTEKEDQHESEYDGNAMKELTDDDVTAQAIIFFFAGFETVSTALCFTSYQLSHNPEVQRRLQQEVDQVWENSDGKPSYADVQGMKYLDAVINEALRMHPPVLGVDRVCQDDITLPAMGATPAVTIRKGQVIFIPIMGIHYNPEHWPEPDRFDPERFSEANKHKIEPFTHMPFGLGPRICIGQRFALVEVKLALAHLMRHFNLTPSPKTEQPLRYTRSFNLNVRGGFWSYLSPRNNWVCPS